MQKKKRKKKNNLGLSSREKKKHEKNFLVGKQHETVLKENFGVLFAPDGNRGGRKEKGGTKTKASVSLKRRPDQVSCKSEVSKSEKRRGGSGRRVNGPRATPTKPTPGIESSKRIRKEKAEEMVMCVYCGKKKGGFWVI